jgi:phosphate-selective porin OprO and OprP
VLGTVKVGNQKNPIGLEHMESSRYLDFIERSFNQDLFYSPFNNGFSPGITASNAVFEKRGSWHVGAFAANMNANTNIFGYGIGDDYAYTMRGTLLPYFEQDGRYLVHLGTSVEFRDADDGRVRVRSRGNIRNGPPGPFNSVYADTTSLLADGQNLVNLEAVYQAGSLLIQGEYCFSLVTNATQISGVAAPAGRGDVWLNGGYCEVLYFLTGESRAYSHERGAFDRVIPHENAFHVRGSNGRCCTGLGAWQVGIRYDFADLNDNGLNGGTLDGLTLGLNWFLNPNMKFQANCDWTSRGPVSRFVPAAGVVNSVGEGDVLGFGTRLAIDF